MSEELKDECITVACPKCGLEFTDFVNDVLRKQLKVAMRAIDEYSEREKYTYYTIARNAKAEIERIRDDADLQHAIAISKGTVPLEELNHIKGDKNAI